MAKATKIPAHRFSRHERRKNRFASSPSTSSWSGGGEPGHEMEDWLRAGAQLTRPRKPQVERLQT